MHMKIYFPIVLLIFLTSCQTVDRSEPDCVFKQYDLYARQAMLNYMDGQYQECVKNFDKAFNIKDDESENDYFYAAAAALRIQDNKKAKDYIIDAIVNENAAYEYFESFQGFDGFRATDELKSISEDYVKYQDEFKRSLPYPELIDEMDKLIDADQSVRGGTSSREQMMKQDSLNIQRLIEITDKYGWQHRSWLLLWHHRGSFKDDNYVWSYFRPLIDSLIQTCEIRPDYWAMYEDFNAMLTSGNQIYGTMWGNYYNYPIKDVENIDKIRESVGLPPLWYMNKVYSADLPEGYSVPNTVDDPNSD
jgi:tetratricopeptide (TPR) repeat protein